MSRVLSHKVETKARDYIRTIIDKFDSDGDTINDALYRDITERDYGVDAIVELFSEERPTGKNALLQIKGTQNPIVPLRKHPSVSCKISTSNAAYALQHNIPVLLIYICIKKPVVFYYARIQDLLTNRHKQTLNEKDEISVRIPISNCSTEGIAPMISLINEYYSE